MTPQQQQQQHDLLEVQRQQDYLDAQRATVEAVEIGRATLEQASRQGEQLDRAESIADDTQYTLDKAGRILRGMTWSGWLANKFTKDVERPSGSKDDEPPLVYEGLPESCRSAVQAIQNYHANLNVLKECQESAQQETLHDICDSMYHAALSCVQELNHQPGYQQQLSSDLTLLRKRQDQYQPTLASRQQPAANVPSQQTSHESLSNTNTLSPQKQQVSQQDPRWQQQDEHLHFLSQNLTELGAIAGTLQTSIHQQTETIDRLDEKSDSILEQANRVTRRADRLTNSKRWTPPPATFVSHVSVRHTSSGLYMAVIKDQVMLIPKYIPDLCLFAVWKRTGSLMGLKHDKSNKWLGQSLFGSLTCSTTSFRQREEWQLVEKDWHSTPLLCASAGWGAGGYLMVQNGDTMSIGGSGVEQKRIAALWCLEEREKA